MGNLYSFGCSYSSVKFKNAQYIHKKYPEHKLYNELLAEELNLNLINDAYEGRGNNSIILGFAETEFEDNSLVIIQLTFPNRIEFRKNNKIITPINTTTISQPITSATLEHFSNEIITQRHKETYLDFVNEWNKILTFTDIYNIVNSIKKKQIKYPNCKFLLITPNNIQKEIFENNLDLYEYITLNGFYKMNIEDWDTYGKLINDDKYKGDRHCSPNGNKKLYEIILNIIKNERNRI